MPGLSDFSDGKVQAFFADGKRVCPLVVVMVLLRSHVRLFGPHGWEPPRLLCEWNFPGRNTGVGCHVLLPGISPTQGSNVGLLHCKQILHHLSRLGRPVSIRSRQKSSEGKEDSILHTNRQLLCEGIIA